MDKVHPDFVRYVNESDRNPQRRKLTDLVAECRVTVTNRRQRAFFANPENAGDDQHSNSQQDCRQTLDGQRFSISAVRCTRLGWNVVASLRDADPSVVRGLASRRDAATLM